MAVHGQFSRQPRPDSLRSPANGDPGLFGRMFDLPPLEVADDKLLALAAKMVDDPAPADVAKGDAAMPAGITYLGQFIDHDITLDTTSLSEKIEDPEGRENFRTPALDLDSLYGLGPGGSPHLYERDPATFAVGPKLLIGTAAASPLIDSSGNVVGQLPELPDHDLPRQPRTGIAVIGDPRNDENLLVAQLHVAFMRFHNRVVDHLKAQGVPGPELFTRARQQVTWHYQWLVLHEFLETITGEPGIAERIMAQGRRWFRFQKFPFMPIEHAVATYRFGHSMVREVYSHNRVFRPGGATPATLELLFAFTAKSGQIVGSMAPAGIPLPQPVLPSNWVIDWRRFFDFGTPRSTPGFHLNHARRIDAYLTKSLHKLPGEQGPGGVLAFRNLRRGVMMRLPSGQDIANRIGVAPLTPGEIGDAGPDGAVARQHGLHAQTPLWYYVLKEAELRAKGEHLGPLGATLVAEVMVGLVQGSPSAYLSASPAFRPTLGAYPGQFTMVDLLRFADAVNPLGDG